MTRQLRFARAALCGALLLVPCLAHAAADVIGPNILVEVEPQNKDRFKAIRDSGLDIVHNANGRFEILVTEAEIASLRGAGDRVTIKDADVYAPMREIKRQRGSLIGGYTTYDEMVTRLQDRVANYPSICTLTSEGTSHEGRDLWVLKISDNPGTEESEPGVFYMGTIHARELITVEVVLAIADSLLMNYGTDQRFTDFVNDREIYLMPMCNPDGHVYCETNNVNWRKNRRDNPGSSEGVDLNRNFAFEWGHDNNGSSNSTSSDTYRGPSAASEPETQAIQAFTDARPNIRMNLTFHSYGDLWLWGPGYKPANSKNQDIFEAYGAQVAALNGYFPGNPGNGAIYITNGDTGDWMNNSPTHPQIFSFTPEVGPAFYPPESQIPTLVHENMEASFLALEYAARPERWAPPGQPLFSSLDDGGGGDADLAWSAPTDADTEVVQYELTRKEDGSVVTDGFESGAGAVFNNGWVISSARARTGSQSLWSNRGDNFNKISYAKEGYEVQPSDQYTFWAWYDIETNWDYAYAVVSTDGGRSFTNLAGTGTTMSDPNGNNADNGITGSSGGWQQMTYDLSSYVGQTVWLGVRYYTDGAVDDEGIYIDDVWPRQEWTTSTVVSTSIAGTSYTDAGLDAGDYAYTLRGLDVDGDWGYPSATGNVTIANSTGSPGVANTSGFQLSPGVPNPFGRKTTIRFRLPDSAQHSLIVFDVAGRKIRTLSTGIAEAGIHAVDWDARDEDGKEVLAGVYFYKLTSKWGERTERVVLKR